MLPRKPVTEQDGLPRRDTLQKHSCDDIKLPSSTASGTGWMAGIGYDQTHHSPGRTFGMGSRPLNPLHLPCGTGADAGCGGKEATTPAAALGRSSTKFTAA